MKEILYGYGKVSTGRGILADTRERCLLINTHSEARPIGATPRIWADTGMLGENEIVLRFANIESARTVQDEIGMMIAEWALEIAGTCDPIEEPRAERESE